MAKRNHVHILSFQCLCHRLCRHNAALDLDLFIHTKLHYVHIRHFTVCVTDCVYKAALDLFIRTKIHHNNAHKDDRMAKTNYVHILSFHCLCHRCAYNAALDLLLCIKLRYAHILSFHCLCHRCAYNAALDLLLCIKLRYAHILSFHCLCHRCVYNSALDLFIRTKLLFDIPYKNDRMAKRTLCTSCHFTVWPVMFVVTSCLFCPGVVLRPEMYLTQP